ncbi:P-loop containing nucleoside triphosphate hydrolase protein [Dactylonectria macrodidyma]|uniref:P-loop containing nucleoside triphosphate hydrolase protein n=1 Tax=Dactylonectria macrodidyma TaxID=307937 RepID=A0A9P9EVN5_9HYPO|nr:P-loop containing nucleoside triphosphate hydrolase protein [Dactylonectria macrodidyma]
MGDEELAVVGRVTFHDEGFVYHADEEDATNQPGNDEENTAEANDGILYEYEEHHLRGKRSNPKFAAEWLLRLLRLLDDSIFLLRILVASSSVMFLDVVKEAIGRRAQGNAILNCGVVEYNGTMSLDERAEAVRKFNLDHSDPGILLLSTGAGGTGLNLFRSSRLVICEPFWAPGQRLQVIGRVHRMPQKRKVYVYDSVTELSDMDMLKKRSAEKKQGFVDSLDPFFIRHDTVPPIISESPSRHDLED